MTKSDLVERISSIYPYMSVRNVDKVVSIVIESIVNTLKNGGRIELRGFGAFSVRDRGKTEGRNPRTGEKVIIEAKKVPFFRPGKQLKDLINGRIHYESRQSS
ncbi:MAG: integration host factor subunit beta [Holosporaceae bacterium]|jgi:integration host factor subunit beta|nr:integration host factor subunit beta [Holosporaceae bacterium]